eukprot:CAMPEP_0119058152 /NCGR_PEP_ID=MMETSP1178-20130426/2520_1 /TAXON_ID=33656 /ORGANISM="unid sp, Strain CCMP2000" /LENGTH=60 /DNA_ID=CAMNT_0007039055 /DNA_START=227 /DNA_END=409 /DNA_ORIENTATION=+
MRQAAIFRLALPRKQLLDELGRRGELDHGRGRAVDALLSSQVLLGVGAAALALQYGLVRL